jgi:hypothetical protein
VCYIFSSVEPFRRDTFIAIFEDEEGLTALLDQYLSPRPCLEQRNRKHRNKNHRSEGIMNEKNRGTKNTANKYKGLFAMKEEKTWE